MAFNVLLTGVGGEGVLFTSVLVARAANIEGHEVRGTQLHGLAQRGGQIPTHVRFGGAGERIFSPTIPRGEADLILGLEPVEAVRSCYFASKNRTGVLVDNYPIVSVYSRMLKEEYPSLDRVREMLRPFARKAVIVDASKICSRELGDPIYGNTMALGVAVSQGLLPLKERSLAGAIRASAGRHIKENLKAFRMGLEYKTE
jgi:indolepyruvate ferredoxin oxidoreductase beta subunit